MNTLQQKKARLYQILQALDSAAVAFSSGVDSTFLLKAAHEALGDKIVAVTARAAMFPGRELDEALAFCKAENIPQIIVDADEMSIEGFRENPENRCYLCKKALFTKFLRIAAEHRLACVIEGSNVDDLGDYRPGMQAVKELGIKSPLKEAGLTKDDIRQLSKEMNLPTWNKPSFACLASRFVYGEPITPARLAMVEAAENYLMELGFRQVRVRVHGDMARIELLPQDLSRVFQPLPAENADDPQTEIKLTGKPADAPAADPTGEIHTALTAGGTGTGEIGGSSTGPAGEANTGLAGQINATLRSLGFTYVALDLGGYQTGSMNRTLQLSDGT